MAATVEQISGGRLILVLGSGWNQREFDAFGYPFEKRVSRFEEAFHIITSLIRTGHADFEGEFHVARNNYLIPRARPDLPIMIGSTGPRMLSISAGRMDWWNEFWLRFDNAPEKLAPLVDRVDAALSSAGRDPAEVVKSVALYVQLFGGTGRRMGSDRTANTITASADEIADQILAFAPLIEHVQLVVDPITVESIEALAPAVAAVHRA
jgi:alkanesulfonate monooxygenase SsuD/methylene tetrahydromethanopterin reductase-like flavin-dependent oxidoreductase (luciferase family)